VSLPRAACAVQCRWPTDLTGFGRHPCRKWLRYCFLGIMQYVFLELITALIILVSALLPGDVYGENDGLNFSKIYPYTSKSHLRS
jgi:hypothetical protein